MTSNIYLLDFKSLLRHNLYHHCLIILWTSFAMEKKNILKREGSVRVLKIPFWLLTKLQYNYFPDFLVSSLSTFTRSPSFATPSSETSTRIWPLSSLESFNWSDRPDPEFYPILSEDFRSSSSARSSCRWHSADSDSFLTTKILIRASWRILTGFPSCVS